MASSKYENLRESLEKKGTGEMTVFGHSMEPILQSTYKGETKEL